MKKFLLLFFILFSYNLHSEIISHCDLSKNLFIEKANSGFINIYKLNQEQSNCVKKHNLDIGIEDLFLFESNDNWMIHFFRYDFLEVWGGKAEQINDELILISEGTPHTTERIFFNTNLEKLIYIPNAFKITLFENNEILFEGIKTYFKGGGAIWFDATYDLKGNILKFNNKGNKKVCHSVLKIWSDEYAQSLIEKGLDEVCVYSNRGD